MGDPPLTPLGHNHIPDEPILDAHVLAPDHGGTVVRVALGVVVHDGHYVVEQHGDIWKRTMYKRGGYVWINPPTHTRV